MSNNTRFSTRRQRVIDDTPTAQSGDPLTRADIREGIINTFLAPLRWLRDLLARWVERVFVR